MNVVGKFKYFKLFKLACLCIGFIASILCVLAYALHSNSEGILFYSHRNILSIGGPIVLTSLLISAIMGLSYIIYGLSYLRLLTNSDFGDNSINVLKRGCVRLLIGGVFITIPFITNLSFNIINLNTDYTGIKTSSGLLTTIPKNI